MSTSRNPSSLNYLVIFNPTLTPEKLGQEGVDDDDAIEQSHILFYTSKEQAVSRDRMLRQVGLAKALINFAEMFTTEQECDSIHSQRKRMLMISPEPNYWIHASIDVPKTPKQTSSKDKSKKVAPKSKGKEKEVAPSTDQAFDYQEHAFLDEVLRTQLRRGYEMFKLLHGSFEYIRLSLGNQYLERLLERFFSIWASKWDVASICDSPDFGLHLGLPLHSLSKTSESAMSRLYEAVPHNHAPLLVWLHHHHPTPVGSVFCPRTSKPHPPQALIEHLISMIPPPPPLPIPQISPSPTPARESKHTPSNSAQLKLPNLTLPNLNLGGVGTMANPKNWGWFSIGKAAGSGAATPDSSSQSLEAVKAALENRKIEVKEDQKPESPIEQGNEGTHTPNGSLHMPTVSIDVDRESLRDAMSTHGTSSPQADEETDGGQEVVAEVIDLEKTPTANRRRIPTLEPEQDPEETEEEFPKETLESNCSNGQIVEDSSEHIESLNDEVPDDPELETVTPIEFQSFTIFIDREEDLDSDSPEDDVERRKVEYLVHDRIAFAVVHPGESVETESPVSDDSQYEDEERPENDPIAVVSAVRIAELLGELVNAITQDIVDSESRLTGRTASTANERDSSNTTNSRHIILSTTPFGLTTCSPGFKSTAPHLFAVKDVLSRYDMALEVFSRSVNDQRWYAGKKKPVNINDKGCNATEGFVEVGRKEASLVDVDRELDQVLRKV